MFCIKGVTEISNNEMILSGFFNTIKLFKITGKQRFSFKYYTSFLVLFKNSDKNTCKNVLFSKRNGVYVSYSNSKLKIPANKRSLYFHVIFKVFL